MADTAIEWAEKVWNPLVGCTYASPGCTNCYAVDQAWIRSHNPAPAISAKFAGTVAKTEKGHRHWTGQINFDEAALLASLRWKKPARVFVNSMSDLFHENVPDEQIDRIFAVMALCPQHTFQVLTKRADRMREYFAARVEISPPLNGDATFPRARGHVEQWANLTGMKNKLDLPWRPRHESGGYWWGFKADMPWPLPNVWLGVSVENQQTADERIPHLLATPAALRWISAEPLLGPVDLGRVPVPVEMVPKDTPREELLIIDWVVTGGESGKHARPMHPDWARSLRDQCAAAGVPFFFKQWGEWEVALDRDRDDPDWRANYSTDYNDYGKTKWLNLEGGCGFHGERFHVMQRVGKKRTGRLLDGTLHDAFPQVPA